MSSLKYATRTLLTDRGFTAAAVLMIALGIGANTAMFSIVRAVLLRPLGFPDPERVVMLWPRNLQRNQAVGEIAFDDHLEFRRRTRTFERIAVISSVNWWGTIRIDGGEPFGVPMSAVSAAFFDVLEARPLLGRTFRPDEDTRGAPRVMVLSHSLWTRRFNGDPGIIGRVVTVKQARGEEPFEIIGVMPREFFFPRDAEYWTPAVGELMSIAQAEGGPVDSYFNNLGVFYAVARLSPGISLESARADANATLRAFFADRKLDLPGEEVAVTPVLDHIFGNARGALQILMGTVLVVLLIVCTNVASLHLARGAARTREFAVRTALGASRTRIAAQLLTESAALSLAGAALGILAAAAGLDALIAFSPADIPRLDSTELDPAVLAFAVGLACLTALAVGALPAWTLSAPGVIDGLRGSNTGIAARSGGARARQVFVTLQVAATVVLLVAAGLCVRSFARINSVDMGYDATGVLTFLIERLDERYPDLQQRNHAADDLLARFERLPGVSAAGAVYLRPFEAGPIGMDSGVILEGQPLTAPDTASRNPMLNWQSATPGYFRAMGIALLRGRNFDDRDTSKSPLVVIVSDAAASRLWPGEDPIGKRILARGARQDEQGRIHWQTVVGVVESARYRELESPRLEMYVPHRQADSFTKHFVVRTTHDPGGLVPALQAEVASFDRALSLGGIKTMEEIVATTQGPWRFNMMVFTGFALVALGLAAVGLFALIAYAVSLRTREIGVRIALGATPRHVVRLMLSQGTALVAVGLVGGLIAAFISTRLISALLFEVSPTDPLTFAAVACVLVVVAMLASYLPARRAAKVDPIIALRAD